MELISQIVFSVVAQILFTADIPPLASFAGMTMIICAGVWATVCSHKDELMQS